MNQPPRSHRRDFLVGRAAAKAAEAIGQRNEPADDDATEPNVTAQEDQFLLEFSRKAMACNFEVLLPPEGTEIGSERAVEALDFLEEIEDCWSVYRDHSLMSRVNRLAAEQPVAVDDDLFSLLQLGLELFEKTEGAFDMTSGPLTRAWGFFRREGKLPSPQELDRAIAVVDSRYVQLDPKAQTVQYGKQGIEINLGGIGKGYALDLCVDRMTWGGASDFLFHGGQSSVVARGKRLPQETGADAAWRVGVVHPVWPGKRLLDVTLEQQALGTSGTSRQHFYQDGKRYGHIFDPRTGHPAEGIYSSTVIAPTAAEADALATAFYVMGVEASMKFCELYPQYIAILTTPGKSRSEIRVHTVNLPDEKWRRHME